MQTELFKMAVSAFIIRNKQLLLLKRRDDDDFLPGAWEVPGGSVEGGESVAKALERESREEAGVEIAIGELFGYFEYADGQGRRTVNLNFLCAMAEGSPEPTVASGEMDRAEWADLEGLKNYQITGPMREACVRALAVDRQG